MTDLYIRFKVHVEVWLMKHKLVSQRL